jgi:pyrimidine-nucleoside phosphorylase
LVLAQGGDVTYVDQPDKLQQARFVETVLSPVSGFLSQVHARLIGEASVNLGAGRAQKGQPIDHSVGFEILHKVGEHINAGEALFIIHANDKQKLIAAKEAVLGAHSFSQISTPALPLFYN